MMYKYSFYNIPIKACDDGTSYIWNSKSDAIINLENDIITKLSANAFDKNLYPDMFDDLLSNGIIVPNDLDEFNKIVFNQKQAQYAANGEFLNLIISPTLKCNYKCVYCFEENNEKYSAMDLGTINNIVSFVESCILNNKNLKRVNISWFGGEPLLAYKECIIPLSEKLIETCTKHNVTYKSKMTTNGFFLTEDILPTLIDKLKVTNYQITFDGTCENYCARKKTNPEAYKITKNNIFNLLKYASINNNVHLSLRINVDKDNIDDAKNLVEEFKSDHRYMDGNISFYLGKLFGSCQTLNYFSLSEFENADDDFIKWTNQKRKRVTPKQIWCQQFAINSLCIGPLGEIYKCEHDFGLKDRVIGDVQNGLYFNKAMLDFIDQPINEKCKACKLFPVCLGGCPHSRFLNKNHYNCEFTIDNIIKNMREYI